MSGKAEAATTLKRTTMAQNGDNKLKHVINKVYFSSY